MKSCWKIFRHEVADRGSKIAQMRRDGWAERTPVSLHTKLALTATASMDPESMHLCDVADWVGKPFELEELLA